MTDTINELESLCAENGIEIIPIQRLVKDQLVYISLVSGDTELRIYQIDYSGALLVGDLTPKKTIDILLDRVESHKSKELRELVRFIMHQCNDGNPRCNECIGWNGGECVALLRMRELGVVE